MLPRGGCSGARNRVAIAGAYPYLLFYFFQPREASCCYRQTLSAHCPASPWAVKKATSWETAPSSTAGGSIGIGAHLPLQLLRSNRVATQEDHEGGVLRATLAGLVRNVK